MSGAEQIRGLRSALRAESRLHAETKIDLAEARLQIAALQAVIAHTLDHLDEQMETDLPLFPESIAVRLRRVGSVELDRVKRKAAAEALDDAAGVAERLYAGSDTDEWGRGYIAGCDRAARVLRDRATSIRKGATS